MSAIALPAAVVMVAIVAVVMVAVAKVLVGLSITSVGGEVDRLLI